MYLLPKNIARFRRSFVLLTALGGLLVSTAAAGSKPVHKHRPVTHHRRASHGTTHVSAASAVPRDVTRAAVIHTTSRATARATVARRRTRGRHVFYNPWTEPTYADSTVGDKVDGEDLVVRKAAVDALGRYYGTVIVADPQTGRILSMVNQKLGLAGAYQPCSTVKVMVSLASLKEGVVDPSSNVRISRRTSMDMTRALAMSNNLYFARLGQELGFERVVQYGKLFGLGEKAGLDIAGETPGYLATEVPQSGIGMMTSFGDGIRLTPLELTSIIATVADKGTMYYLQYPHSQEEVDKLVPRIKRQLDLGELTESIKPGMMGAVEYGTARRAGYSNLDETILGKTGTCTDTAQPGVHLGWFGSYNEFGDKKLVVVVLLTGGRGVSGPIASGIAGNVYHNLALANYFKMNAPALVTTSLLTEPSATQTATIAQ